MATTKMMALDHLFRNVIDVADDFGNQYNAAEFINGVNFQGAFYFLTDVPRTGLSSNDINFYLFR